jgi:hypothetical protein
VILQVFDVILQVFNLILQVFNLNLQVFYLIFTCGTNFIKCVQFIQTLLMFCMSGVI